MYSPTNIGEPGDPKRGTNTTIGTGPGGTITKEGIPETSTTGPLPATTSESTGTKVIGSMKTRMKHTLERVKDALPKVD